jgi:hypothetical protein
MKHLIAAALAVASIPAAADVALVADLPGGASIELHDVAGPCVGGALRAEYVAADGTKVPGCWVKRPGHIALIFFDGDVGAIPDMQLKPPKKA